MFDLIKEYGVMVFLLVIFILEIVLLCIKRKPKTLDDFTSIMREVVSDYLPSFISSIERPGYGEEKKKWVILQAKRVMREELGRDMSPSELKIFANYIPEKIESILSTPEKKKGA